MQRFSRALDTIWTTSAFDPRKPVSPDWAEREPAPILRSGDERSILDDSPWEHHQGDDAMRWNSEGHGADESFADDLYEGSGPEDYHLGELNRAGMPDSELIAVGQHARALRESGGRLDGSEGHYAEYHPTSPVNNYYTYNPRDLSDRTPWNLVSSHWSLRDPIQSRHQTFSEAVEQGSRNRSVIDRQVR